jgi:hypothetical protein
MLWLAKTSVTYSFVYKTYESHDDDLSKIETCCDAECNNTHVKTFIFYYVLEFVNIL